MAAGFFCSNNASENTGSLTWNRKISTSSFLKPKVSTLNPKALNPQPQSLLPNCALGEGGGGEGGKAGFRVQGPWAAG